MGKFLRGSRSANVGNTKDYIKYPFDKSFRNGLLFLVRKRDERSKSSEMINDSERV